MTREHWLQDAITHIHPAIFAQHEIIFPKFAVSVGRPSGRAKSWSIQATESADNETYHIFISSAVLEKSTLLELLFAELIVCVLGRPNKQFKRLLSLTRVRGKWYPEVGSETGGALAAVAQGMPDYPHVPVIVEDKLDKQTTRMKKVICHNHEKPIILRGSIQGFESGMPVCYCGSTFQPEGWSLEN